jgi:ParB/RepB/Spo0J family partition protein
MTTASELTGYAVLPINCLVSTSFPTRSSVDPEIDDLTESIRAYGVLEPIVVRSSKQVGIFEIVMGERRFRAAKKAGLREIPSIVRKLSDQEAAVLQLTENLQRKDLTDDETAKMLAFLSTMTKWSPKIIAEKLNRSYSWVIQHLPDEFKNEEKAKAGQKGGEARAVAIEEAATKNVASEDLTKAEQDARAALIQCQEPSCLRLVRFDQVIYRNGKPYCSKCAPYIKEIVLKPKEERSVSAKSLDGPAQKDANMHPQKSAFEERVIFRFKEWLSKMGFKLQVDKEFCVLSTTPDAYLPELEGLVYVDGPVHTPKRQDKDERLRELLKKRHDELNIQGFKYKADTKTEEDRVLAEMQKWAEGLAEEAKKFDVPTTGQTEGESK